MFILPYKRGNEMLYTVYCYTFNETLEYSLSNSWSETEDFSNDEENEGTPNCVNKNQRI